MSCRAIVAIVSVLAMTPRASADDANAPAAAPAPTSATAAPTPATATAPQGPSKLPWVGVALGLGLVGTGAAFGVASFNRHDEAEIAETGVDAQALQDDARSYARTANVLYVVGGLVTVASVALIFARKPPPRSKATARATLGPTGFAIEGTF